MHEHVPDVSSGVKRFGPFALLGLTQILIFFNDPRHFFIADSLMWMKYRHHSVGEFLAGFLHVDPALLYRPLSQRAVESVLFPLAGLNPLPYRVVGFILFFACTVAVYALAETLTESRRIAWLTVLVFAPHLIHAFPTYDVSFTPELLFTVFCLSSAVFYVRYIRTRNRSALTISVALFVLGLLSKESAAALPLALLAIWFLLPRQERGKGWSLLPHFAILAVYLAFAVGYLHIRQLNLDNVLLGNTSSVSDYTFGKGGHILENIAAAFSWAFGIPSGVHGQWSFTAQSMLTWLKALRILTCLGAICVFFTSQRNFLLLGIAWFLILAAPGLPLVNHFLPYYLFAALAGFALAAGLVLDWLYAQCSKISRTAAMVGTAILLAGWTRSHATTANLLVINHSLLGVASRISAATVEDIQTLYPTLPAGARVVLFNEDIPSAPGDQVGGALLQLAYKDPTLVTDYVTLGFSIPAGDLNAGRVLVFKWTDDRFVDVTALARQRPDLLQAHSATTNYHLELSATEVRAGLDSYTLRVPELPNKAAVILYALDGRVMEPFRVDLDSRGETRVDVPKDAKWVPIHSLRFARRMRAPGCL